MLYELKAQENNNFPTVNVVSKSTTLDGNIPGDRREGEGMPTETLNDSTIVNSIPKSMHNCAVSILNRLRTHPDIVSWDDTGQVKQNGERIQGSNISDLLGDGVRRRRNFNLVGSKEFSRVLSKLNMPKDLVRNDERWKQAQIVSSPDNDEYHTSLQPFESQWGYMSTLPSKHMHGKKTLKL